ncbi:PilN domain-containing protein [Mesobacillus maritimus]|uniref:Fimbrial assembly protein n=1 Tax=Mesobacillus maritimus TaxID=1643336 RepID=A0ABS7KA29_9BACI|nr:hypothetical protein [Mesobacillus maritimus]MBY0099122.1 hypothetical protein [Mesobacillus maritimus]
MLVEINLLPKKQPRNFKLIGILLGAVLLMLVAGITLLWQGNSYKNELVALDNQIATTQQLVQIQQEKVVSDQASNSVATLETAVKWASEDPLKTVPIIKHVTALLPKRGFIENISYAESGTVNLTVQFDTSKEAAYYLKTLLDSEWFEAVTLSSVSTSEPATAESSSTETQENTDGDEAPETSEDENTTDTEPEKEVEESKTNTDIVPRYIGQYQLTLNRKYINAEQNNKNSVATSEGGEES